ncbi:MAG: Gfo/Idh/MocA family protein [Candidatus Sumerlaeaceae bacterium]|jgi:predicted dehydrogenase
MKTLRIAILSFAHMHAYSYADVLSRTPNVELVAVADPDDTRREQLRRRYPNVKSWYDDHRKLLDSTPCDAVIIASENANHAALTLDALAARMHVLCEKPLATTLADARRMIEAAQRANRIFMTAFPVRFSPAIVRAKQAIDNGELGRILGAATSNHGSMPGGWFVIPELAGGGAVIDHTVHVVDLLRWLFSAEVEEVYAEYANRLYPEIPCEDVGLLLFTLDNGAIVTLDTSWSRCKTYPIWGDVKLEIRGEQGRLSLDCFPLQVARFDDKHGRAQAFSLSDNLDALMLEEFLSAVRDNRQPAVTGEDGLRALEVALAAYRSQREMRPVRITELRDE